METSGRIIAIMVGADDNRLLCPRPQSVQVLRHVAGVALRDAEIGHRGLGSRGYLFSGSPVGGKSR